jgi:hypothetical protein
MKRGELMYRRPSVAVVRTLLRVAVALGAAIATWVAAIVVAVPAFALTATHFSVTGFPSPTVAGVAHTVTITALDANNNVDPTYTGTVNITSDDTQATLPGSVVFTVGNAGVQTASVTLKTAGTKFIKATDSLQSSINGQQSTITVSPASTAKLAVTGVPTPVASGAPTNVTVTAQDAFNNTTPSYTGIVRFTSSDTASSRPSDYTFVAGDSGTHVFTNQLTFRAVGTQSITATDTVTSSINGQQTGISVVPILTVVATTPQTAGVAFSAVVTAVDALTNTITGYTGTVHFTSSDTAAVLPANYTFVAGDNGTHTFTNLVTLKTAGPQTLTATDTTNAPTTGTSSAITVDPAGAATLVVSTASSAVKGTAQDITVTAKDAFSNVATGYAGTVHFLSTDGAATPPVDYTFVPGTDHGVHVFTNGLTFGTVGTWAVSATDTVTSSITGTQSGISVTGIADHLVLSAPASTPAGTAVSVSITAKDPDGNTATGYRGTVHLTSNDAQAVLPADYTFTAADNGVHSLNVTFKTAGSTRTATATDTVTSAIAGTTGNVSVSPLAAVKLQAIYQEHASPNNAVTSTVAGTATNDVLVRALDQFDNLASTTPAFTGIVHFTSTDAAATLPADTAFTQTDGNLRLFTGVVLKTVGTRTITVSDTTPSSTIASGTTPNITVTPAAVSVLSVSGISTPTTAGALNSVTVTAKDAFGNVNPAYDKAIAFTTTDPHTSPAPTLPANYTFVPATDSGTHTFTNAVGLLTTGTWNVVATEVSGTPTGSQSVVVNPATASILSVTGLPASSTAGNSQAVTVTAKDAFGNTASGYRGTVHFTTSDPQATVVADYPFVAGDNGTHAFTNGVNFKTAGNQTLTATDTVTSTITGTSAVVNVVAAATNKLLVTGIPSSTLSGATASVVVTAVDAFDNLTTGYTGAIHFTASDGAATLPADYTFVAGDNGAHTFTNGVILRAVGARTVTATDKTTSSITGTQSGIQVIPIITVTGLSGPLVAGTPGSITVTAKEAAPLNNIDTSYRGTIHFTSTDAQAALPTNYTFVAGDAGTHTFTNGVTLKTVGSRTVTATDTVNAVSTGTTGAITVTPAPAATLMVSSVIDPLTAGTASNVVVSALDAFSNVATAYVGTVHFTSSDAQAVLPANYTFVAGDNGVHTFTNGVTLKTAGDQIVTATDTVTSSITGAQSGVTVNPASTVSLLVNGVTSPTTAGASRSVTVAAKDAFGNTVPGYTGTVHFTSSDATAVLPADYTFLGSDFGTHTFGNGIAFKTAGPQSVTATDTVTSSITGAQSAITVNPAVAASFLVSGIVTPTVAGVARTVTVSVADQFGNVASGYTGTVHFTSTDPQATLPADYTFVAGDNGAHTFTAGVALKTVGARSVTATDTVTSSVNGTQSGITVNPASASTLSIAYASSVVSGTTNDITITAIDPFGNRATGYTGTAHFSTSDAGATVPADYTFVPLDAGLHTFTGGYTAHTAGSQLLTVVDTVDGAVGGSQATQVLPGNAVGLVVSGIASPAVAGIAQTVTVTAQDAQANTATGYLGTVHFTSTDPAAVLPADYTFVAGDAGTHTFAVTLKTAGLRVVTATDTVTPSISGQQSAIQVDPAGAATFTVTGITSPVTAGTTASPVVTAFDAFGNVASGYLGTVHFTSSDVQAVLPADYTFVAGDSGVHTFANGVALKTAGIRSVSATDTVTGTITGIQDNITVNPAAAAAFTISDVVSPTVAGVARDVKATAVDAFGNVATGYLGTVHFTSSDAQAVLPANYTFLAGDSGVHTFTGAVTLKTAGPQSVTGTDTVTASITGAQLGISVTPADATTLAVTDIVSPTAAGVQRTATVTARDPFTNAATGYRGTIHFTSTDAQAVLPADYTFTAADNGVHAFTNGVALKTVGSQTVTATDTVTGSITGTHAAVTVTGAIPATITVTTIPSPTTAGTAQGVRLDVLDSLGNPATSYAGTVHFTSSDPAAVLPADYTFVPATDNGVHVFSGAVTLKTAGPQSVTATDTVTSTITGAQSAITVNPAAPAALVISAVGSPVAGTAVSPMVTAVDAFGNTTPSYTGTVHFTSSDVAAALAPDYTFVAGDNGVHTFTDGVTFATAAVQTLTATDTLVPAITGTLAGIVVSVPSQGYWMVARDGGIFNFGTAGFHGSAGGGPLNQPVVGMAKTKSGHGYWLVAADGGIFTFGDAVFYGSAGGLKLNAPIVGMAVTPSGNGYYLLGRDGGIFTFGDAVFHGSTGNLKLNQPVLGMAVTRSGNGYWLTASDGGIFTFGDAQFLGSTGNIKLNQPIVGMTPTITGNGYWLVARDGGIFTFGDAVFHGSTGNIKLNQPIVGMSRTPTGFGYWLAATDGGIFTFGDAVFSGSTGDTKLNSPIVGMAPA